MIASLALALLAQDTPVEPDPGPPAGPSHSELRAGLAALADAHPELCTLLAVGTSREGRVIEGVRIAAGDLAPGRPGALLVAGLEGQRLFESGLLLDVAGSLCDEYGQDPATTALLDGTTLYVVPRADVDVAEARFAAPLFERSSGGRGVDDDRDDRRGEDPPADVDGDGRVTWMRVPDVDGTLLADPHDPRAHVEADPLLGQRGAFRLVREGFDSDADGRASEDGDGDTVFNANFAAGWEEHAANAGLFPTDEPGVRALAEFVLQHPDLVLVVAYGDLDQLVEVPSAASGGGRVPAPGLLADDHVLLEDLAERYRELTGDAFQGQGMDAGSFQRWCYEHRGLWTLSISAWGLPTEAPPAEEAEGEESGGDETSPEESSEEVEQEGPPGDPSDDAGRLAWIDATGEAWRFVPWRPFEHPQLGAVEIGGFAPYALVEPPADEARAITASQLAFLRTLGDLPARASLASFSAEDLGAGLLSVTAVVELEGRLPLLSAAARRARTTRPLRLRLELPAGATLLAGRPQVLVYEVDPKTRRRELTWLVRGAAASDLVLTLDSDHAGTARANGEVSR